jgi:hypothetical protein
MQVNSALTRGTCIAHTTLAVHATEAGADEEGKACARAGETLDPGLQVTRCCPTTGKS